MNPKADRTIVLPEEYGAFVNEKLASGAYETADDVVGAALQALREKDDDFHRWLVEDVAAAYDEMQSHPETAIPAADVFAAIGERISNSL